MAEFVATSISVKEYMNQVLKMGLFWSTAANIRVHHGRDCMPTVNLERMLKIALPNANRKQRKRKLEMFQS